MRREVVAIVYDCDLCGKELINRHDVPFYIEIDAAYATGDVCKRGSLELCTDCFKEVSYKTIRAIKGNVADKKLQELIDSVERAHNDQY